MTPSGFILPYSLQVKNHRGRGGDGGILQNSLLQSTNQTAAQTCNQTHLLKCFLKGQTCLSTCIPSLSDLKGSKRASVVCCNFFWFGLAIGNSHFSPLLHFQNVFSVHLTGWAGAACVELWKDMLAHCCTAQSSLLEAVHLPWIRPLLVKQPQWHLSVYFQWFHLPEFVLRLMKA